MSWCVKWDDGSKDPSHYYQSKHFLQFLHPHPTVDQSQRSATHAGCLTQSTALSSHSLHLAMPSCHHNALFPCAFRPPDTRFDVQPLVRDEWAVFGADPDELEWGGDRPLKLYNSSGRPWGTRLRVAGFLTSRPSSVIVPNSLVVSDIHCW
jgi:hypothetical protein